MPLSARNCLLTIGLAAGTVIAPAFAADRSPNPPPTLLSFLGHSPLNTRPQVQPSKQRPPLAATAKPKTEHPIEEFRKEDVDKTSTATKISTEVAVAAPRSNRRTAILQRETARTQFSAPAAHAKWTPPKSAVTPHWTPKHEEQPDSFPQADDDLGQPVAVNMAGDLLSERLSVNTAVVRMDSSLKLSPPDNSSASSASEVRTPSTSASEKPSRGHQLASSTDNR